MKYAPVDLIDLQRGRRLAGQLARLRRIEAGLREQNREFQRRDTLHEARLEAMDRAFEELSYCVSHDLRAPLRAMSGFSRILLDEHSDGLDCEARRLLGVVHDNALGMSQLIDGVLEFLRWGRREPKPAPVDVRKLAERTWAQLRRRMPARALRLDVGDLPEAWGDPAMLQVVIANLFSNAIKFTEQREESLIEIGGAAGPAENSYYVRDNGVGFDMGYVDRLFRLFERAHPRGQFEGAGAGLALVRHIVERHGGRVWAEGRVGEGAVVHFTLPLGEP